MNGGVTRSRYHTAGASLLQSMSEQQPTFKVVDRRPFNPDGTPRELSPEEKKEQEAAPAAVETAATRPAEAQPTAQPEIAAEQPSPASSARSATETSRSDRDPLDDPASFVSLIMSLASNAAASL